MFVSRSVLLLSLFVLIVPLACGNDDGDPVGPSGGASVNDGVPIPELPCPNFDGAAFSDMAPLVVEKTAYSPPLAGAFSVSSAGSPNYSFALDLPPGRQIAPHVGIVVSNGGVSVSGLSSISRCGSNVVQDGDVRGVLLTNKDNYCLDGSRLIQIGTGKDSIGHFAEYRTAVDSQTKILGYGASAFEGFDVTYFVAYSPNGNITTYGKSGNARVLWRGVTRSYNIDTEMDRRGNTVWYQYDNKTFGAKDFTTREIVIHKIKYTGFVDANGVEVLGDNEISFGYELDDRHGILFYEGEEVAQTKRLVKIVTKAKNVEVRAYRLAYEIDSATNTALPVEIKECAQDDDAQCKPPVRFTWDKSETAGFTKQSSWMNVPSKADDDQFSWTVADVDGNGTPDLIASTKHPDSGQNRFFVYANDGHGYFAPPIEWFAAPFPAGMTKPWDIVPVDENGDGRIDLLIDQEAGDGWNKLRVLRSVAEPSPHFELVTTNIPRVSQKRSSEYSRESHSGHAFADVDADGMSDAIRCQDTRTWEGHADYIENNCDAGADCKESLAKWTAHLWRPGGFEATARPITALNGVSCWVMSRFFGAVDWNADGQTDLVTAGKTGKWQRHTFDVASLEWQTEELSMPIANVLGVEYQDDPVANYVGYPLTKIRAAQMEAQWLPLRAFFPDLNGDAYPDLVYLGGKGKSTIPFAVINEGRDEYFGFVFPFDDVNDNVNTFYYSPYARFGDYEGDGKDDLILPVGGACPGNPDGTCYVVFESGKIGEPAKIIKTSVPFENQDGDSVAPQYLLKVADVDLNGHLDILHPAISSQTQVFVNQAKPNRLLTIMTGRNPLDPGDIGFLPDISIEYENLVHVDPASPYASAYNAHADASNTCEHHVQVRRGPIRGGSATSACCQNRRRKTIRARCGWQPNRASRLYDYVHRL